MARAGSPSWQTTLGWEVEESGSCRWGVGVLASRGLSSGTGAHGPPAAAACAEEEEEGGDEEENVLPILNADVARVALLGRTQPASTRKILAKLPH